MEKIYYNLTGVDIGKQKKIWDERGKGYYGEFLVLKELYKNIPGACKILMNLQIPTPDGKTTEIDLLMIHETGLYVFEIKHYTGHIYGKDNENNWTQYFRTASNQSFLNPVKQNEYHMAALKVMFPHIPISSIVVFTNDECTLHVENNTNPNVTICRLSGMVSAVRHLYESRVFKYEAEQIDDIFNRLLYYAPEVNTFVNINGEVVAFYQYLETLSRDFREGIKQNKIAVNKSVSKTRIICVLCALCAILICVGICTLNMNKMLAAEKALSDFAQKFEHVREFHNGDLVFTDNLVTVSDVVLIESIDVMNAVNFSCLITSCGENYGIIVGENVMINVILRDGTVKEYDLWNERYPYQSDVRIGSLLQASGRIGPHEFYNMSISDISYIKLTNLGIWSKSNYSSGSIAEGYEIELFDCMKGPQK